MGRTTLIYVTKRCQLVRNITNVGDLRERRSFVVHGELRGLLRHQTVKTVLRSVLEFLVKNAIPAAIDKTIVEVRLFLSKSEIVLEATNLDEL